jgi:hypothetical protein
MREPEEIEHPVDPLLPNPERERIQRLVLIAASCALQFARSDFLLLTLISGAKRRRTTAMRSPP